MQVENEFWRTLFREESLQGALDLLAPVLEEQLGVQGILLRQLDHDEHRLETMAQAGLRPSDGKPGVRVALDDGDYRALLVWARRGELLLPGVDAHADLLALVSPRGVRGASAALPLVHEPDVLGVVVFLASDAGILRRVAARLQVLAEPCVAAIRNHERIREATRLRDALEADRHALLGRLQREDISEAIVGSETGLRDVMRRVGQVAGTEAPVLLLGETGSGKEVIARAIHAASHRAQGPILKVNCGAIPPGLVDSELFGHERGSFTGAHERRRGWFERADGGTLFLDELGDLPLPAQVRLLRVLQEGVLERVGGQKPVHVSVRIVAATHQPLEGMMADGRFREDLWYRIGVFPIEIPPLRDRREDIPALAAHFAWRAGKRLGGRPLNPSPDDIQRLLDYPWPGNIRELAAVIERAAILGDGRRLEIAAALGVRRPAGGEPVEVAPVQGAPSAEPVPGSFELAMKAHIERALRATSGRVEGPKGAAALLDLNANTLRSRMRRLGIDARTYR
jgi:transcriptional regulator with GAF, ATPase, and Fis domain